MTNHPSQEEAVSLTGVAETLLWPLWMRTEQARKDDGFFEDPLGIALIDKIKYDFAKFGKPNGWHAVRAKFSDDVVRRFLAEHPHGSVVALGEGLETQFWRVDNGTVRWFSVDLPESIAVRRRFLPSDRRNSLIACSALQPAWMDSLPRSNDAVLITAAGLLMYFSRQEVESLLRTIAARLPGAELFCDMIPKWYSQKTQKGLYTTARYRAPSMPFGLNQSEIAAFFRDAGGFEVIKATTYPEAYPSWSPVSAALMWIPWLRELAPSLVHARARRLTSA